MTDDVKIKLKELSKLTKKYCNMKSDFDKVTAKSNECTEAISAARDKYIKQICEKLNDPLTSPKTYWKILNRLLSNKKVSAIPPVLFDGKIISNFSQKAAIFNKYFASQCTPLQNSSSLPKPRLRTDKTLSSLNIREDDIFVIVEKLNSNKSHGWDDLSIKMIKLCGKSVACSLKLIFETCLLSREFPECWKRTNVVPVHKKERNLVKSYRPITLLQFLEKFLKSDFQGLV